MALRRSGLGHSRRLADAAITSGLLPGADISRIDRHVSKVPITEMCEEAAYRLASLFAGEYQVQLWQQNDAILIATG